MYVRARDGPLCSPSGAALHKERAGGKQNARRKPSRVGGEGRMKGSERSRQRRRLAAPGGAAPRHCPENGARGGGEGAPGRGRGAGN